MADEKITENIERLASEIVMKISNLVPSNSLEKSNAVQRELMKLRLTESVKMAKYLTKVYETFASPVK